MEKEFTRELLNTINGLAHKINSLTIWLKVFGSYSVKQQRVLRSEFTRVPLYYCLHKPSEFRDRLIFCASHLCHQANLLADKKYEDNFSKNRYIMLKTLKKVCNKWQIGKEFIDALNDVADSAFQDESGQYRNKAQHRIPPSLEYGHTNLITRDVDSDGSVSYGFGYANPITTEKAIPLLIKQWKLMQQAFNKYWALVQQQNDLIKSAQS